MFAKGLDFDRENVFGFFETLGSYAGKLAPLVLAFMGLKNVLGGIGKVSGGIGNIFSSIGAIGAESAVLNGIGNALIGGVSKLGGGVTKAISSVFSVGFKALNPVNFVSLVGTFFTSITKSVSIR